MGVGVVNPFSLSTLKRRSLIPRPSKLTPCCSAVIIKQESAPRFEGTNKGDIKMKGNEYIELNINYNMRVAICQTGKDNTPLSSIQKNRVGHREFRSEVQLFPIHH